jgi:hypothetical protein
MRPRKGPGGPKQRRAWGMWLTILALGLVTFGLVGVAIFTDDPDMNQSAGQQAGSADEFPKDAGQGGDVDSNAAVAGASRVTLSAGAADLLDAQADAAAAVGQQARGEGLRVESVVPGEGFFVERPDDTDSARVYVEFGGDVGEDETDQGLPKQGDEVELRGEVRPAPQDPRKTLKLNATQAQDVSDRGFFVNADTVEGR